MAFPKTLFRKLDGKPDSTVVNSADEERTAKAKGFYEDENRDGIPDPVPGSEYPKMLHGVDRDQKPMTKVVEDAADEKKARAAGWGDAPVQDHGPVESAPEASPKSEAAEAKAGKKK